MKKIMVFCFIAFIVGCTYEGTKIGCYVKDPSTLLEDPLSVNHQQALDDLESSYLNKEITYAEYVKQKQQIEDDYQEKVQTRTKIIENADNR